MTDMCDDEYLFQTSHLWLVNLCLHCNIALSCVNNAEWTCTEMSSNRLLNYGIDDQNREADD